MDEMLDRLNRATFEALESMRKGEVPLLDPAFEPELCAVITNDVIDLDVNFSPILSENAQ